MCSRPKCDMAGLINGPVGNLVGMGIKSVIERASSRNAEAESSRDKDKIKRFYDNIEAHLHGALRVLQPALEINRMILRECKSAGHEKSVQKRDCQLVYYTPQNPKKSGKCCGRKKSTECCENENMREWQHEPSTSRGFEQLGNSASSVEFSEYKDHPKICYSPARCKKSEKSQEFKKNSYSSKKACSTCGIKLKENGLLAELPCTHLFCYPCLGKAKYPNKCRICNKSFEMKNINDISASY